MPNQSIENFQVGEMRESLRQMHELSDTLAKQHGSLSRELAGAIELVLEQPQTNCDQPGSTESPDLVVDKSKEECQSRQQQVSRLLQKLRQVQSLSEDLKNQETEMNARLAATLQELHEIYHAEVEARAELGGEG